MATLSNRRLSVTEEELATLAEALDTYVELLDHEVMPDDDLKDARKLLKRIKRMLGEDDEDDGGEECGAWR